MKTIYLVKARLLAALVLLAGLLLGGCGKPLEEADVMYAGPMLDTILEGIRVGDYDQFSRDFSEAMKDSIGEEDFPAIVADLHAKLGDYEGRSFTSAVRARNPAVDLMIVKYQARYTNDSDVTITIYFSESNGTRLIEGFLIDSPSLDQ